MPKPGERCFGAPTTGASLTPCPSDLALRSVGSTEAARLHLDEDPEEANTGEIELGTGEVEIVETGKKMIEEEDDDSDGEPIL